MRKRIKEDWNNYKIGIGTAMLYLFLSTTFLGASCPSRIFFQKPCPGCGLTRAALCLVTFRWKAAWNFNAMIFPLTFFLAWCFFFRYIRGKKIPFFYVGITLLCISILVYYICKNGYFLLFIQL